MTKDQEFNLRLMLSNIYEAEEKKIALSTLIPELERLFNAAAIPDADWVEGFWDSWGDMEISYAVALDSGWTSLDESGERIVSEAIESLKALIATKLACVSSAPNS